MVKAKNHSKTHKLYPCHPLEEFPRFEERENFHILTYFQQAKHCAKAIKVCISA
jgi:hypothetical protein